jgi:four helix bundle protein
MLRSELQVERLARALAASVYRTTASFPVEERYGLTRELRRSAVSVGSNVAEGAGRRSEREFARFVDMALGSGRELRFQLLVAMDLQLGGNRECWKLIQEWDRLSVMLSALQRRLLLPCSQSGTTPQPESH